jgi:DNA-binding response OmpR family regulator
MNLPKRIVVVDDDTKVRQLLEHALRPPEFQPFTFRTGAEALRHIPEVRPACIVSDIFMPDLDGESLLRALRAVPGLQDVPFIAVSAVRSEARIRSVLAAGANAFLLKPFPLRDLLEKIRTLLARPAAHQPSTATWTAIAAPPGSAGPGSPDGSVGPRPPGSAVAPESPAGSAEPGPLRGPEGEGPRRVELRPPGSVLGFGRYTRVETSDRTFVVLTETSAKPRFTVTTVITEKGVALRRIETAMPHPLARDQDQEMVRRQMDQQHDDVLQRLPRLVVDETPRRVIWSDQSRSVDPGLLAWTVSALAQHAEAEVGTAEAVRQLRRTHTRVAVQEDTLRNFYITESARVVVDPFLEGRLPRRAVEAVAGWCRAFALEALEVREEAVSEPIRRATRGRGAELERLGFYGRIRQHVEA